MSPAEDHRLTAAAFADVMRSTPDWDAPTPVAEWTARDVVGHLVEWFPGFLAGGSERTIAPGPHVAVDPVAAWEHHAAAVQAILDDPAAAEETFTHPHVPTMPLPDVIAQFYTADVFMHTWDLARASGQDAGLDEERCRQMLVAMEPMDQMLRQSGQYGARVAVPADATWCDKLMGFIGRDPAWRP